METKDVARIAAEAEVDPRTVKAYLAGKKVRTMGADRIQRAMKKLKLVLPVAIAAILASGCAATYGDSYHVSIDSAFTTEQQSAVLESLDHWDEALAGRVSFTTSIDSSCSRNDAAHLICVHASTSAYVKEVSNIPGDIGFTLRTEVYANLPGSGDKRNDSADVYIPTDDSFVNNPAQMQSVVSHELGHAMGLEHTHEPTDLMYYALDNNAPVQSATCDDVQQWETLRNQFLTDCTPQVEATDLKGGQL